MQQQSYSFWARALHRLALSGNAVAEVSFDLERKLYRVDNCRVAEGQHVFVTGLARAGTTILMRTLHETGAFRSLTYRDMPFVLAPNTWRRISNATRKNMDAEERAHGDGILVDYDSPEAMEEVFWRVRYGGDYVHKDRLVPAPVSPETERDFKDYVALLLRAHPGQRYLSKNNNNVLRLRSLARCFPNAVVLIAFREPLQQAYSLMRQHRLFLERQADEPFARDYMTWLVHHEFGQDHRPFVFDEAQVTAMRRFDPETHLGYWLQSWINTYSFVAATASENCIFLSYERLCDDAHPLWPSLCSRLNLDTQPPRVALRRSSQTVDADVPEALAREAGALYETLRERETWH